MPLTRRRVRSYHNFAPAGFTTITDSFTAANGTALAGRTTDTGAKLWLALVGTFQIQGNQAAPLSTNGGDIIVFDAGVSDCTYAFQVGTGSGGYCGLVLRLTDASNYWKLIWDGDWSLYSVIGGVSTSRKSGASAFTPGDIVGVRCSGDTYQIVKNGADIGTPLTFTHNTTATKVGLYLNGGSVAERWDNISVTVP